MTHRTSFQLTGTCTVIAGMLSCLLGSAVADRHRPDDSLARSKSVTQVRLAPEFESRPGTALRSRSQSNGGVAGSPLFDNGSPNGVNGLSSFEGTLNGEAYDRTVADDLLIEGDGVALIEKVLMSGVWFSGDEAPGPLEAIRVRVWNDDGGTPRKPASPIGSTVCDQTVGFIAENTGDVYNGRPEVQYTATLDEPCEITCDEWYWIAIQPTGATDNFFHLVSANGNGNLTGEQIHLSYQGGAVQFPWPTPGYPDVFGEPYDVTFQVFGVGCTGEPNCPWDLTGDGNVDGADLGQLLAQWGPCEDCDDCPPDFDGNCVVDGADLGQLLANWGECP